MEGRGPQFARVHAQLEASSCDLVSNFSTLPCSELRIEPKADLRERSASGAAGN